jgi:predicted Zn-dependent peptidase
MAGLGKWQAEEAHELILGQMSDLATNLISEEELRRNKVKAVNKLKMALDSTGSRFNMLLEATLEDTLCPNYWQSSIDDILDVTAEDIRTIARRVVAAPKTLGLIGK